MHLSRYATRGPLTDITPNPQSHHQEALASQVYSKSTQDQVHSSKIRLRNATVEYIIKDSKVIETWPGYRKIARRTTDPAMREIYLSSLSSQHIHQLFHFLDTQTYLDRTRSIIPDAESDFGPVATCFMHLDLYTLGKQWKLDSLQQAALSSFATIYAEIAVKDDAQGAIITIIQQAGRTLKISDPVHRLILELSQSHRDIIKDSTEYDKVLVENYDTIPEIGRLVKTALGTSVDYDSRGSQTTDYPSKAEEDVLRCKAELQVTRDQLKEASGKLDSSHQAEKCDRAEQAGKAKEAIDAVRQQLRHLQVELESSLKTNQELVVATLEDKKALQTLENKLEALRAKHTTSDAGQLMLQLEEKEEELNIIKQSNEEYIRINAGANVCKKKLQKAEDDLAVCQKKTEELASRVEELQRCEEQLKQTDIQLQNALATLTKNTQELAEAEGYKMRFERTLQQLDAVRKQNTQKDADIQQLEGCRDRATQAEADLEASRGTIVNLQAQITDLNSTKIQLADTEVRLEAANKTIFDQMSKIAESKECKEQLDKAVAQLNTSEGALAETTASVKKLREQCDGQAIDLDTCKSDLIYALKQNQVQEKQTSLAKTEKTFYQNKHHETQASLSKLQAEHNNVLQNIEDIATGIGSALETYQLTRSHFFSSPHSGIKKKARDVGDLLADTHSKLLAIRPFADFDDTETVRGRLLQERSRSSSDPYNEESMAIFSASQSSFGTMTTAEASGALLGSRQMVEELQEQIQELKNMHQTQVESLKLAHTHQIEILQKNAQLVTDENRSLKKAQELAEANVASLQSQLETVKENLAASERLCKSTKADYTKVEADLRGVQQQLTVAKSNFTNLSKSFQQTQALLTQERAKKTRPEAPPAVEKMASAFDRARDGLLSIKQCGNCRTKFHSTLCHTGYSSFGVLCRACGTKHLF